MPARSGRRAVLGGAGRIYVDKPLVDRAIHDSKVGLLYRSLFTFR